MEGKRADFGSCDFWFVFFVLAFWEVFFVIFVFYVFALGRLQAEVQQAHTSIVQREDEATRENST